MKIFFRLFLVCTLVLSILAEDVILPCEFSHKSFYGYTCTINSVNVPENANIIGISGTHLVGYGNENVKHVNFESSALKNFPQILLNTFNNLEYLYANSVSMSNLDRLANCSRLLDLNLQNNWLETIKNSTFEDCGNLEIVWLSWNRLTHLEVNAFKGLERLSSLHLSKTKNLNFEFSSEC